MGTYVHLSSISVLQIVQLFNVLAQTSDVIGPYLYFLHDMSASCPTDNRFICVMVVCEPLCPQCRARPQQNERATIVDRAGAASLAGRSGLGLGAGIGVGDLTVVRGRDLLKDPG